jgi:hypothetical protein
MALAKFCGELTVELGTGKEHTKGSYHCNCSLILSTSIYYSIAGIVLCVCGAGVLNSGL